jgi:serine/threonine protein kinase
MFFFFSIDYVFLDDFLYKITEEESRNVYLARDTENNILYAIKVQKNEFSVYDKKIERLVASHKQLLRVYTSSTEDEKDKTTTTYIVMELCIGSLAHFLTSTKYLNENV